MTTPDDPGDERLLSGEAWAELCRSLERAGRLVLGEGVPDRPRDRAEGYRYLARFLASGIASCITHDDADSPVFGRMIDYVRPWGLDNPDCLYLYAPLRGDAAYRVWGARGSANAIDFQVNFGHFAEGDISKWGTISSVDDAGLEVAPDGSFELRIGGDERSGNWLASRADAEFILVRQYFDDWEREVPADLFIERVGASGPIPPPRTDWMADHLEKLTRWIERGGGLWETMSKGFLSGAPNSLVIHMPDAAGERAGMAGLAYGMGNFACEPGEAVVVSFEPPRCHHWGVALANWYWECVEYASRQSSINRAQATLDSDGRFRAVIAHEDPGVANWLDPAGNTRGTLTARFLRADGAPKVSFVRVPRGDLAAALPADTKTVTPAERAEILARRHHAVVARFRR
jgi:hypothetical protein